MKQGDAEVPLARLSIIRFETGNGSKNLPASGDANHQEWTLVPAKAVNYHAACGYDEEIIGIPLDPALRRCWLERKPGSAAAVTTWCSRQESPS